MYQTVWILLKLLLRALAHSKCSFHVTFLTASLFNLDNTMAFMDKVTKAVDVIQTRTTQNAPMPVRQDPLALYFTASTLLPALVSSGILAARAYRKKSLTPMGCVAGFAVGMVTTTVGGIVPTIALYDFFVTSTLLTKMGAKMKRRIAANLGGEEQDTCREKSPAAEGESSPTVNPNIAAVAGRDEEIVYHKSGNRNAWQVMCNGGIATAALLVYFAKQCDGTITTLPEVVSKWVEWTASHDKAIMMAVIAHYAAAIGDTYSSEVGVLSGLSAKALAGQSRVTRGMISITKKVTKSLKWVWDGLVGTTDEQGEKPAKRSLSPSTTEPKQPQSRKYARLILGGRPVPKGTNGGVSTLGTVSAVLGGLQLAIVIVVLTAPLRAGRDPLRLFAATAPGEPKEGTKSMKQLHKLTKRGTLLFETMSFLLAPVYCVAGPLVVHVVRVRDLLWVCPAAALAGTLVDSILGQLFQASYATKQAVYEAEESYKRDYGEPLSDSEPPSDPKTLVHVSGLPLLTNNQVNLISLAIVSVGAFAFFRRYTVVFDGAVGPKDSTVAFVESVVNFAKFF